jgi:DNA replication and repair protein RecF
MREEIRVYVSRLALDHFRSWPHLVVDFTPGVTILKGANGLGKTNIVEAVEVLSTGSSHRVSGSLPLIERGESKATVRANIREDHPLDDNKKTLVVDAVEQNEATLKCDVEGLESREIEHASLVSDDGDQAENPGHETTYEVTVTAHGANRGRINGGNSLYMRDIVGKVPSVSFTPEDQRLVVGDPAGRRSFLDQAGSQLNSNYAVDLANANKVAKQRAILLKQLGQRGEPVDERNAALSGLEVWTGQFISVGVSLTRMRARLVDLLAEPFSSIYDELAGKPQHAGLQYVPSFQEVLDFDHPEAEISKHYQRLYSGEIARGRNLIGPHRDDIALTLDGMPAREFASNGEMWTMALALKMALFGQIAQARQTKPIVILDDVFAQLDEKRRRQILDFATRQDQVLITVAAAGDIPLETIQAHEANIIDVAALKTNTDDENAKLVAQLMSEHGHEMSGTFDSSNISAEDNVTNGEQR